MTPERRKSVLVFEVGKRVREMGSSVVKKDEVDGVVNASVGLGLGVVEALKDRNLMGEKVSSRSIDRDERRRKKTRRAELTSLSFFLFRLPGQRRSQPSQI